MRNSQNVTQLAVMEDRFPVWDEIHCYLILGNVLLARAKQLAAGLLAHLNSQTPAHSGKRQSENPHGTGRHFFMNYICHDLKTTFIFIHLLTFKME